MSTVAEKAQKAKITLDDLDPKTVEDAQKMAKAYVFTEKSSVATIAPDYVMGMLAEQGVTKEAYIAVKEAEAHVHRVAGLSFGLASTPHLKTNTELTHTSVEIATTGKDKIAVGFKRTTPYTIRDGEGNVTGTGVTYGTVSVDHKSYSTKKRGEMTKISSLLNDLAEAQLS